MRRPAFALVLLTAAGAATALAAPSSAHVAPIPAAGAVTVITAAHSGTAQIVLYDDATLSPRVDHNPDVTISGRGRLVGFTLTAADPGSNGFPDELAGWRLPSFAGGGTQVTGTTTPQGSCPQPPASLTQACTWPDPKAILLHEGYYRLDVLTDGSPVRITLRLHGQRAKHGSLRLKESFASVETPLTQRESIGASTITYGGQVQQFAHPTQLLVLAKVKVHDGATFRAATACLRSDSGAPPAYAFSAACPGGQTMGYDWWLNTPTGQRTGGMGVFAGSLVPMGDPNGVGGSVTDLDGPQYVGGIAVWISSSADTQPFSEGGPFASR